MNTFTLGGLGSLAAAGDEPRDKPPGSTAAAAPATDAVTDSAAAAGSSGPPAARATAVSDVDAPLPQGPRPAPLAAVPAWAFPPLPLDELLDPLCPFSVMHEYFLKEALPRWGAQEPWGDGDGDAVGAGLPDDDRATAATPDAYIDFLASALAVGSHDLGQKRDLALPAFEIPDAAADTTAWRIIAKASEASAGWGQLHRGAAPSQVGDGMRKRGAGTDGPSIQPPQHEQHTSPVTKHKADMQARAAVESALSPSQAARRAIDVDAMDVDADAEDESASSEAAADEDASLSHDLTSALLGVSPANAAAVLTVARQLRDVAGSADPSAAASREAVAASAGNNVYTQYAQRVLAGLRGGGGEGGNDSATHLAAVVRGVRGKDGGADAPRGARASTSNVASQLEEQPRTRRRGRKNEEQFMATLVGLGQRVSQAQTREAGDSEDDSTSVSTDESGGDASAEGGQAGEGGSRCTADTQEIQRTLSAHILGATAAAVLLSVPDGPWRPGEVEAADALVDEVVALHRVLVVQAAAGDLAGSSLTPKLRGLYDAVVAVLRRRGVVEAHAHRLLPCVIEGVFTCSLLSVPCLTLFGLVLAARVDGLRAGVPEDVVRTALRLPSSSSSAGNQKAAAGGGSASIAGDGVRIGAICALLLEVCSSLGPQAGRALAAEVARELLATAFLPEFAGDRHGRARSTEAVTRLVDDLCRVAACPNTPEAAVVLHAVLVHLSRAALEATESKGVIANAARAAAIAGLTRTARLLVVRKRQLGRLRAAVMADAARGGDLTAAAMAPVAGRDGRVRDDVALRLLYVHAVCPAPAGAKQFVSGVVEAERDAAGTSRGSVDGVRPTWDDAWWARVAELASATVPGSVFAVEEKQILGVLVAVALNAHSSVACRRSAFKGVSVILTAVPSLSPFAGVMLKRAFAQASPVIREAALDLIPILRGVQAQRAAVGGSSTSNAAGGADTQPAGASLAGKDTNWVGVPELLALLAHEKSYGVVRRALGLLGDVVGTAASSIRVGVLSRIFTSLAPVLASAATAQEGKLKGDVLKLVARIWLSGTEAPHVVVREMAGLLSSSPAMVTTVVHVLRAAATDAQVDALLAAAEVNAERQGLEVASALVIRAACAARGHCAATYAHAALFGKLLRSPSPGVAYHIALAVRAVASAVSLDETVGAAAAKTHLFDPLYTLFTRGGVQKLRSALLSAMCVVATSARAQAPHRLKADDADDLVSRLRTLLDGMLGTASDDLVVCIAHDEKQAAGGKNVKGDGGDGFDLSSCSEDEESEADGDSGADGSSADASVDLIDAGPQRRGGGGRLAAQLRMQREGARGRRGKEVRDTPANGRPAAPSADMPLEQKWRCLAQCLFVAAEVVRHYAWEREGGATEATATAWIQRTEQMLADVEALDLAAHPPAAALVARCKLSLCVRRPFVYFRRFDNTLRAQLAQHWEPAAQEVIEGMTYFLQHEVEMVDAMARRRTLAPMQQPHTAVDDDTDTGLGSELAQKYLTPYVQDIVLACRRPATRRAAIDFVFLTARQGYVSPIIIASMLTSLAADADDAVASEAELVLHDVAKRFPMEVTARVPVGLANSFEMLVTTTAVCGARDGDAPDASIAPVRSNAVGYRAPHRGAPDASNYDVVLRLAAGMPRADTARFVVQIYKLAYTAHEHALAGEGGMRRRGAHATGERGITASVTSSQATDAPPQPRVRDLLNACHYVRYLHEVVGYLTFTKQYEVLALLHAIDFNIEMLSDTLLEESSKGRGYTEWLTVVALIASLHLKHALKARYGIAAKQQQRYAAAVSAADTERAPRGRGPTRVGMADVRVLEENPPSLLQEFSAAVADALGNIEARIKSAIITPKQRGNSAKAKAYRADPESVPLPAAVPPALWTQARRVLSDLFEEYTRLDYAYGKRQERRAQRKTRKRRREVGSSDDSSGGGSSCSESESESDDTSGDGSTGSVDSAEARLQARQRKRATRNAPARKRRRVGGGVQRQRVDAEDLTSSGEEGSSMSS